MNPASQIQLPAWRQYEYIETHLSNFGCRQRIIGLASLRQRPAHAQLRQTITEISTGTGSKVAALGERTAFQRSQVSPYRLVSLFGYCCYQWWSLSFQYARDALE